MRNPFVYNKIRGTPRNGVLHRDFNKVSYNILRRITESSNTELFGQNQASGLNPPSEK
jgi:hypothetical protein